MARRRNMTKKQKRIVVIAAGTAVAGVAVFGIAYLVGRKKALPPEGGTTGGGGVTGGGGPQGGGAPTPLAELRAAMRHLCVRPNNLSGDDMRVLIDNVFSPLWDQLVGTTQLGPADLDAAVELVARNAVKRSCRIVRPSVLPAARQLAHAVWLEHSDLSGQ